MDEQTLREYRRIRRQHASLGARQALLWARGNGKPTELDWESNPGRHVAVAATTRDGFDIRITVDYDEYATTRIEFTDKNTGIRNPKFRWLGDQSETNYRYRNDPIHGCRFLALESDSTLPELAKEYRKWMSRNDAWETARESLREEADTYLADDYCEFVLTATASIAGIELGSNSIAGYDVNPDVRLEKELDNGVVETGIIFEAIHEARENLEQVTAAQRAKVEALDKVAQMC